MESANRTGPVRYRTAAVILHLSDITKKPRKR